MKSIIKVTAIVALVAIALIAGFWLGKTGSTPLADPSSEVSSPERKVLYYRNPMGLPDISPVPKKDPMGMDYVPVYAGEEPSASNSAVRISPEKIQKLGVKTEAVALRNLARTVRAVSTVQPDERSLYTVAPKFEGWIQRLYVNTTGQSVKRGDPLMDVYSPELVTAQHEYLIAKKGTATGREWGPGRHRRHAAAGRERLAAAAQLGHIREDLKAVQEEGRVSQNLTLRSPAGGIVLEKKVIQGQRFMPGEILYQIADLSNVWMLADVFEQDLALVRKGQTATIRIDAYPDKLFNGKVTYIYPTVDPATRTAKVRIELPNAQGLLKPDMYGRVEIVSSASGEKVLAVPDSAVLHTGTREVVLVDLGEGRYEPRTVKLGPHADGYAEVLGGLKEGERVVVKANFLIDAESNLKAALSAFGDRVHGAHGSTPGEDQRASAGSLGAARPQTHHGEGIIEAIDFAHATVTLAHGPIASLAWPAMVMDFRVQDPAWLRTLKPGQKIGFEIIEESAGEYVIVRLHGSDEPAEVRRKASDQRDCSDDWQYHRMVGAPRVPRADRGICTHVPGARIRSGKRPSTPFPTFPTHRSSSTPSTPVKQPQVVEDQVTYPLTTAMLSVPKTRVVRGLSNFGVSFVYVIFEDGTDIYWARSRVLEYLSFAASRLPANVRPSLGPDASGVGWVYQYVLVAKQHALDELRAIQDWYLRYQLTAAHGVSEVASVGGFVRSYQVTVDPWRLQTYGIPLNRVSEVVAASNRDVGGRVIELSETEYVIRGKGYLRGIGDLEKLVVKAEKGTPVLLRDIARVELVPEERRGIAELDGDGRGRLRHCSRASWGKRARCHR